MTTNYLVTGAPRSGKTTVVERTLERLAGSGVRAGGVFSPELRVDGERIGFELVDVATDQRSLLAHVDRRDGPKVGSYRVNVDAVDELAGEALARARRERELVVVDEIASMQLHSDVFVAELERALDAAVPVLGAVQSSSEFTFVDELTARPDTRLYRVTPETRDELPDRLTAQLHRLLE